MKASCQSKLIQVVNISKQKGVIVGYKKSLKSIKNKINKMTEIQKERLDIARIEKNCCGIESIGAFYDEKFRAEEEKYILLKNLFTDFLFLVEDLKKEVRELKKMKTKFIADFGEAEYEMFALTFHQLGCEKQEYLTKQQKELKLKNKNNFEILKIICSSNFRKYLYSSVWNKIYKNVDLSTKNKLTQLDNLIDKINNEKEIKGEKFSSNNYENIIISKIENNEVVDAAKIFAEFLLNNPLPDYLINEKKVHKIINSLKSLLWI